MQMFLAEEEQKPIKAYGEEIWKINIFKEKKKRNGLYSVKCMSAKLDTEKQKTKNAAVDGQ